MKTYHIKSHVSPAELKIDTNGNIELKNSRGRWSGQKYKKTSKYAKSLINKALKHWVLCSVKELNGGSSEN